MLTFLNRTIVTLAGLAHHMRRRHEQIRAQRVLDSLPEHLRKDIGWPEREFEALAPVHNVKPKKIWDAEAMLARTECPSIFSLDGNTGARNGV